MEMCDSGGLGYIEDVGVVIVCIWKCLYGNIIGNDGVNESLDCSCDKLLNIIDDVLRCILK